VAALEDLADQLTVVATALGGIHIHQGQPGGALLDQAAREFRGCGEAGTLLPCGGDHTAVLEIQGRVDLQAQTPRERQKRV